MTMHCIVSIIAICLAFSAHASGGNYYYIVKKNEFASGILFRAKVKPIYGKKGALDMLTKFNKKFVDKIDHLTPGKKLYFPKTFVLKAQSKGTVKLTAKNEILFIKNKVERLPTNEPKQSDQPQKSALASGENVRPEALADAQSQEINKTKPQTTQDQSSISLALETGFARLDSSQNSGHAVLLSKPTLGFNLEWSQKWSDSLQSYIGWNSSQITFLESSQGTVNGGDKQTVSRFSLGADWIINNSSKVSLAIGTREEIFSPSYSTGTASLEIKPISFAKLTLSRSLAEVHRLSLSGFLGGSYLNGLPGSRYDIKAGFEYYGGLRLTHKLKSVSIFALGEYGTTSQDTTLFTSSRKDIRTQLGISFPFGYEEEQ